MNDDWRLQVTFGAPAHAWRISAHLEASELRHDLARAFGDRLIVTVNGNVLFIYAGSREQIEKAGNAVASEARLHRWETMSALKRWHPGAELWEDPDKPLPQDDDAKRAERAEFMVREREETRLRGYPEFEARAELSSYRDAVSLAERLRREGIPVVHRWRYLLVGATDEDAAKALADRIRREAPSGARVKVEGTAVAVRAESTLSPFTVFRQNAEGVTSD